MPATSARTEQEHTHELISLPLPPNPHPVYIGIQLPLKTCLSPFWNSSGWILSCAQV